MKSQQRTWWLRIIRGLLVILAISPLAYAVYQDWDDLRLVLSTIQWLQFLLAQLLVIAIFPLLGLISFWTVRTYKSDFRFRQAFRAYFVSQIPKYLPGGFWAIPTRALIYRSAGVPNDQALISVFREISILFLGAASISFLGVWTGIPISQTLRIVLGIGTFAGIVLILLTQVPALWGWLRKVPGLQSDFIPPDTTSSEGSAPASLIRSFIISLVFWILLGVPFLLLIFAVYPDLDGLNWFQAAAIFSISWAAGFVVVFAPAGLGIRETVMVLLLTSIVPRAEALGVALVARVWWIFAEVVWILVSLGQDGLIQTQEEPGSEG